MSSPELWIDANDALEIINRLVLALRRGLGQCVLAQKERIQRIETPGSGTFEQYVVGWPNS